MGWTQKASTFFWKVPLKSFALVYFFLLFVFLVSHLTSQHSLTLGVTAVMSQKTGFIIQTQYLFLLTDILIFDLLVSPLSSDTHEQYAGKKMENQKSNESD